MKGLTRLHLAREIVAVLVRDLSGRKGLRQAWEGIDEEDQKEVVKDWENTVLDVLDED
jgi:hypothetical protein